MESGPCFFTTSDPGYSENEFVGMPHLQFVASTIASDLTEDQHAIDDDTSDSIFQNRTGIAPKVDLCLIAIKSLSGQIGAVEKAIEENVDVISTSCGTESVGGGYCNGRFLDSCPNDYGLMGIDSFSVSMNTAFESGIFITSAAGNNNVKCPCRNIYPPASASGVFAVGAYSSFDDNPNGLFQLTGIKANYSAEGPAGHEDYPRTKPDILAPSYILFIYV